MPGATVTVLSQVNISQRVLDDTLSLSPISLLLISGVSRSRLATFTNYLLACSATLLLVLQLKNGDANT